MTNRIGLAVIAGCIAVGSLAVAGCGGGGSGVSGASGSALTKTELVTQANAICKEVNTKVEALPPFTGSGPSAAVSPLTKLIAINRVALAKQEALTPPSDQRSDWNKFIAISKQQQALSQKALDAARAGDEGQMLAASKQIGETAGPSLALTTSLGLTECAKTPQMQG